MNKAKVAEKLGWVRHWEEPMFGNVIQKLNGWYDKENNYLFEFIPDWENSLDAQARDIWPTLLNFNKPIISGSVKYYPSINEKGKWLCSVHHTNKNGLFDSCLKSGITPAQACWKAILEVFGE